MFNSLQEISSTHNITFNEKSHKYADIIINLYNGKIYYVSEIEDPYILNIIGEYYHNIKKDNWLAVIYYVSAINKGRIIL